jgi:hypothetical protein
MNDFACTHISELYWCCGLCVQYFFENADALEGRFVAEVYYAGFCYYFGDASSSPPFFTYLGLVALPLAAAAFIFRLFDRL